MRPDDGPSEGGTSTGRAGSGSPSPDLGTPSVIGPVGEELNQ
jgi:hypothetical protein